MANLNGQNIGTNYKGFLNLDSTINTPLDATLRAVTDGMGTNSALSLSTAEVSIGSGTITSNGVATIKGAGSNILSLRDSLNAEKLSIDNSGNITTAQGSGLIVNSLYSTKIFSSGNHNMTFQDSGGVGGYFEWRGNSGSNLYATLRETSFDLGTATIIKIGGTTSSFPAIKRNAAAIDFRLADDSAYAQINTGNIKIGADNASQYIYASTGGGTVSAGFYLQSSTNKVSIYTSGSERVSIDSLGVASFTPAAIGLSAGATNPKQISLAYTINNSGAQTGTATGIFLNATETALNGMTHNLMDLQKGGVSQFSIANNGNIYSSFFQAQTNYFRFGGSGNWFKLSSNGVWCFQNDAQSDFGRIQLGGTTSSFPAIKRNGAAIDFRLADDSGYCAINANGITTSGLSAMGSGAFIFEATNANYMLEVNGLRFGQSKGLTFYSAATNSGSPDAGFYRSAASTLRVSDGSTGYGKIEIGNTVTAAVAVTSTHKVTINIGGTTYYLLASNV